MTTRNLLHWAAIVGVVGGVIALISWSQNSYVSTRPDRQYSSANGVTPQASMPVDQVAVNTEVQFDLFLGSGFLIKDCGDNGVDIGDGIHRGDIIVRRKDVDLHVSRTSGSEQVICTHFFSESDNANKAIRFADGSKVDYYDIAGN